MFRHILTEAQQTVLELLSRAIAAMKLAALAGRGSPKDLVDLRVYAHEIATLEQAPGKFRDKYRAVTVDPCHCSAA